MEHEAVGHGCSAAFILRISTAWHGIGEGAQESFLPYSTTNFQESHSLFGSVLCLPLPDPLLERGTGSQVLLGKGVFGFITSLVGQCSAFGIFVEKGQLFKASVAERIDDARAMEVQSLFVGLGIVVDLECEKNPGSRRRTPSSASIPPP